jgi:plasmid stabilization system protein ParE
MARLLITESALADLDEIWLYIAQDSYPQYADAIIEKLFASFKLVQINPNMGAKRDDIGKGVRLFPVEKINIIYWLKDSSLEVLRVHHSALNSNILNLQGASD